MTLRISLIFLLLSCLPDSSFSQNPLLMEAFEEFALRRFWEYEEIPVDWTMKTAVQADFNEGFNSLLEGIPAQAEPNFTAVLAKDSLNWQAYYYRAAARKQQNKVRSAESDLQHSLKIRGDFYEGYVELAKARHLLGLTAESDRAINKAIRLDKSRGTAYYLKGDIRLSQNRIREASNNYNECLSSDSMFHNARIKLALLELYAKKEIKPVLRHLDKVLAYDSLQKTALLFRGILISETDINQSIRDLTKLISVSPDNTLAHYYRGVFSTEVENYEQAFVDFHKVTEATSTSDNHFRGQQSWLDKKIDLQNTGTYTLRRVYGLPEDDGPKLKQAFCHALTQKFDKCIAVINQTSAPNKEPLAVYLKAVAYEHKGEHQKAFYYYDLALELDDEIADAYKKRAIYEQELKQWDASIADFTRVLRLNPETYVTYRLRAISHYHNNQFEKAIADFDAYLRYDSLNKKVIGERGMAFLNNNQRLKAYVDFAVSANPQALNFKDIEKLVDSVLVAGDTAQALHALDRITTAAPYFTEGFAQKFKICMARKEWEPIERDIAAALRNGRVNAAKSSQSYLLTLQAMIYFKNRFQQDAIKTFDEAIKVDKSNVLAYLERGKALMAMGKTSKAESDYRQASSLGNEEAGKALKSMGR
jgi:tetratricopeptide (TPR) repeat protein